MDALSQVAEDPTKVGARVTLKDAVKELRSLHQTVITIANNQTSAANPHKTTRRSPSPAPPSANPQPPSSPAQHVNDSSNLNDAPAECPRLIDFIGASNRFRSGNSSAAVAEGGAAELPSKRGQDGEMTDAMRTNGLSGEGVNGTRGKIPETSLAPPDPLRIMSEQIERRFLVQLVANDGAVQDVADEYLSFTSGIDSSELKELIRAACAPLLNDVGFMAMRIRDHPDFLDHVTADSFPGHGREGEEPIVITVAATVCLMQSVARVRRLLLFILPCTPPTATRTTP
ncbi:unnamed protein product [Vitrella brassicaformis CCMP3155]|uniref:Uncharacterized protein n=1 Tax=Vitrella brassicaformis (strain CCMP3155) TaxID=1169540 RepID=A0A0G4EYE0_VITBC|nr:unnamed protein product [Vitrella brassicaformis CCMP3155]|eukprot:CEM03465.1 unnamed protein product [Vitrella brassicaformis CCMP3155]